VERLPGAHTRQPGISENDGVRYPRHVELRASGTVLHYSILELPPLAGPIEADSKALHHLVDRLVPDKRPRDRHYRDNQPAALVAKGVTAAKTISAQKRVRST
jgi:hypothetical protein